MVTSWQQKNEIEIRAAWSDLEVRAKDAWGELVRDLMPWQLIINAATFDVRELQTMPRRGEQRHIGVGSPWIDHGSLLSVSRDSAKRRFGSYFREAREALQRPVEGFMACEVGPSGLLEHGHGLLWLSGGVQPGDITVLSRTWWAHRGNWVMQLEVPGRWSGSRNM